MDRIYKSGAVGTEPTIPEAPSEGFPTDGNPLESIPPTIPGAHWFHMVAESICNAITDAGLTLDGEDYTLLSQAIQSAASVPDANTTTKGKLETSTDGETQTGTSQVVAVTPDSLSSRTATETRTGLAEILNDAEAQAWSDDTRIMTVLKLVKAFQGSNQSLAAGGYQKIPGGLIVQWGYVARSGSSTSASFPISFPTAVYGVFPIGQATSYTAIDHDVGVHGTPTTSGFSAGTPTGIDNFFYFAIGK